MKTYKDFKKQYIGSSDIAGLIFRAPCNVTQIYFGEDGLYDAYECFGECEIGEHYEKVFSGSTWLKIYDDSELTYSKYRPNGYQLFDVYRAGSFGCVIHWHE